MKKEKTTVNSGIFSLAESKTKSKLFSLLHLEVLLGSENISIDKLCLM